MVSQCRKVPLVFECEGEQLVGILTLPLDNENIESAVISLPAGGPQYRVGLARQLVKQAEYFATQGIATLRFDYRGIGDSDGEFGGFDSVAPDLEAAITTLSEQIPTLKNVILWGGCNAASAIMMHAWRFPLVNGIVVSNPYLGKHNLAEKAKWLHFYNRIMQKSFWQKLFKGQYDFKPYLKKLAVFKQQTVEKQPVAKATNTAPSGNDKGNFAAAPSSSNNQPGYVIEQMLNGLTAYQGQCLLFLSENSIQSNEFRVLLKTTRSWKRLFKQSSVSMQTLASADQNISSLKSQEAVRGLTLSWLKMSGYVDS